MSEARVLPFDRTFYDSAEVCSRIGEGALGGKANGLLRIRDFLQRAPSQPHSAISIPRMAVLATDVFDAFMERNRLWSVALSGEADDHIARAFQRASLPSEMVGDLRAVTEEVTLPLAVRSSSLLEDALERPFAGVYETKMIPNNQLEPDLRFQRLVEAVKFVYASTFFRGARTYRRASGIADESEKMAVMVQEVVGRRHGARFYPHISAVARSYSYYPSGRARPEDGVANLALGLGKTIVDGGVCWSYSPRFPKAPPPFASTRRMLEETQTRFWAVNMGRPPAYDPIHETEYLLEADLGSAEADEVLRWLASTYDAASDRLIPGTGTDGSRVLDFAPLLKLREYPLNDIIRSLLELAERALAQQVEIELAMVLPEEHGRPLRVGFLQARAMAAPAERVTIDEEAMRADDLLLASRRAMGNGVIDGVCDVVYTRPDNFEARHTRALAQQVEAVNLALLDQQRPYLLIGFGRWGSADPWLGIPVTWSQIAGAKVIVEAMLPNMNVEPSQGSHFFHNLSAFGVVYLTVPHGSGLPVDWEWLASQEVVSETALLRHVRLTTPLEVRVDGRTGRGIVRKRTVAAPETVVPV